MRILMLSCEFMPETFGGAEQQCLKQSAELVKRGHSVVIVTSRKSWKVPAQEMMNGVEVRRFMTFIAPDLLGRYLGATLLWIAQLVVLAVRNRGRFDIVHCHQGKFGIYMGAVMARILGLPQIVKMGNSRDFFDLKSLHRKKVVGPYFLNYALRQKPVCVAISAMIAQDLREFGITEPQIVQIVNGVIPVKAEFKTPDMKALQFFWHGRFEAIKNLTLMLDGFALACAKNPHIHLNLIGSGRMKQELAKRTEYLGIADRVHFLPPCGDILKEISKHDVFINTSYAEGLSNSMLEAMACGKVIISTPVSGAAEIIDEGKNGFVIRDYTEEAIAEVVLRVADLNPVDMKGMFLHNMKKTHDEFDIVKVIDQYELLYSRLAQTCPGFSY
jgi:glycosyltransferase involved in cell wall biosynthesis